MKIGIFGDSYGCDSLNEGNTTLSWPKILAQKYNLDNHCHGPSNFFFSIENFKKLHSQYDRVVFLVTKAGRLYLPPFKKMWRHVPHRDRARAMLDHSIKTGDTFNILIYESVVGYYNYVANHSYDSYVHHLMVQDVVNIRPDAILIPCYIDSTPGCDRNCLFSITYKEDLYWNALGEIKYIDRRHCHMTAENNRIFANKVDGYLKGEPVSINIDDFVTTDNKDFYLTRRE